MEQENELFIPSPHLQVFKFLYVYIPKLKKKNSFWQKKNSLINVYQIYFQPWDGQTNLSSESASQALQLSWDKCFHPKKERKKLIMK